MADSSFFIQGISLSFDSLFAEILFLLADSTTPLERRPSESPFLYRRSSIHAGTMSIEIMKVVEIPISNVFPTVLIGSMGTRLCQVSTLKPTIVVKADRKIAFPVVMAALTLAVRLICGSKGSGSGTSSPSLFDAHASSSICFRISLLFSSILLVRCSE